MAMALATPQSRLQILLPPSSPPSRIHMQIHERQATQKKPKKKNKKKKKKRDEKYRIRKKRDAQIARFLK